MTDDIVADLRIIWTSCSDRINKERAAAADEIERLQTRITELEEEQHRIQLGGGALQRFMENPDD